MKVQELRQLLSASDRKFVEMAFVKSYKQLRKGQKEEIDPVLIDILKGNVAEKKKTENGINFEDLEKQIDVFIKNAYAQNYIVPNRTIPKSQRPKWRFMVKNFIKELEKIPPESEKYVRAVKLLKDLYTLMCDACNYYLFSSDDPFRSIGWEQPKLFELLVKKTFAVDYSRENISQMLLYATTGGLSRESLHIEQEMVLLGGLRTSDVKLIAMEEAKKLVEERAKKLKGLGKQESRYDLEDAVNELCGMILLLSIVLAEPETGVTYYFKHARKHDREITLYCALDLIDWMEEEDLWIKVYEDAVKGAIKPRESLKCKYEKYKRQVSNKT